MNAVPPNCWQDTRRNAKFEIRPHAKGSARSKMNVYNCGMNPRALVRSCEVCMQGPLLRKNVRERCYNMEICKRHGDTEKDWKALKNLQSRLWISPSPIVAFQSHRSIAEIAGPPIARSWPKYTTTNDNRTGGKPWANWLQQDLNGSMLKPFSRLDLWLPSAV